MKKIKTSKETLYMYIYKFSKLFFFLNFPKHSNDFCLISRFLFKYLYSEAPSNRVDFHFDISLQRR